MKNRWKALALAAALLFTAASMAGDKRKPSPPKPVSQAQSLQPKGSKSSSSGTKEAAAAEAKRRAAAAAAAEAQRKARALEEARRRALVAEQAKKQAAEQAKNRELGAEAAKKKAAEEARRQLLAADAKKKTAPDLASRSFIRSLDPNTTRQPNQIPGRNLDVVRDRSTIRDSLLRPVDLRRPAARLDDDLANGQFDPNKLPEQTPRSQWDRLREMQDQKFNQIRAGIRSELDKVGAGGMFRQITDAQSSSGSSQPTSGGNGSGGGGSVIGSSTGGGSSGDGASRVISGGGGLAGSSHALDTWRRLNNPQSSRSPELPEELLTGNPAFDELIKNAIKTPQDVANDGLARGYNIGDPGQWNGNGLSFMQGDTRPGELPKRPRQGQTSDSVDDQLKYGGYGAFVGGIVGGGVGAIAGGLIGSGVLPGGGTIVGVGSGYAFGTAVGTTGGALIGGIAGKIFNALKPGPPVVVKENGGDPEGVPVKKEETPKGDTKTEESNPPENPMNHKVYESPDGPNRDRDPAGLAQVEARIRSAYVDGLRQPGGDETGPKNIDLDKLISKTAAMLLSKINPRPAGDRGDGGNGSGFNILRGDPLEGFRPGAKGQNKGPKPGVTGPIGPPRNSSSEVPLSDRRTRD